MIDEDNGAIPLLRLSASGYLPLGEENGEYLLLRLDGRSTRLTGYETGSV